MITGWVAALTVFWGAALATSGIVALYVFSQNRGMRSRLDVLERRLLSPPSGTRHPWEGAFTGFLAGNSFEAENIVSAIAWADEYGMAGCKLAPDDIVIDIGAHMSITSLRTRAPGSAAPHPSSCGTDPAYI